MTCFPRRPRPVRLAPRYHLEDGMLLPGNDAVIVMSALSVLTPNQREAFVDAVVLEHEQTQIAARMGISKNRVGQLIRNSQSKLAREVGA